MKLAELTALRSRVYIIGILEAFEMDGCWSDLGASANRMSEWRDNEKPGNGVS